MPVHFCKWSQISTKPQKRQPMATRRYKKILRKTYLEALVNELKSTLDSFSSNLYLGQQNRFPPLPGSGFLQIPWQHFTKPDEPATTYIITKRNYKLYTNIGEPRQTPDSLALVLTLEPAPDSSDESGADWVWIWFRLNELPTQLKEKIKSLNRCVTIRSASGETVHIVGSVDHASQIGTIRATVNFLVAKQFSTKVIICFNYCDLFVEAIQ